MVTELQTRTEVCPEHGEFESKALVLLGRMMRWSGCPVCSRERAEREEEEKIKKAAAARNRMVEDRMNRAGIPFRFREKSLKNFTANTKGKADCLRAAVEFSESFQDKLFDGETLIFAGLPGTGKSHLAIGICHEVISSGHTAFYVNALDAIRMIRSTWRRESDRTESQVMDDLARVDLLVIDEIGVQYGTDGEQVILFEIINRRYQDQMPMILLTNQGKDGFRQYLGDRAFDRLRESGRWVVFDWPSHRGISAA